MTLPASVERARKDLAARVVWAASVNEAGSSNTGKEVSMAEQIRFVSTAEHQLRSNVHDSTSFLSSPG